MAKKPKAPAANTSALTDDERLALHLQHTRRLGALKAAIAAATSEYRNGRKVCKSDLGEEGLKEVDVALGMQTPEGEAEQKAAVERILRVARYQGADFGEQLGLLDTVPARNWYQDGKRAGLAGLVKRPPDGLSQHDAQSWLEGWEAGQAVLMQGFKKTEVVDESPAAAAADGEADDDDDLRGTAQRRLEEELATGEPSTIGTAPSTAKVIQ